MRAGCFVRGLLLLLHLPAGRCIPSLLLSIPPLAAGLLPERVCKCMSAHSLPDRLPVVFTKMYIHLWVIQEDFSCFAFSAEHHLTCRTSPPLYISPAERTRWKWLRFAPPAYVNSDEAGYEIKGYPFPGGACRLLLPSARCSPRSIPEAVGTGPARGTAPNTISTPGWGPPSSRLAPMIYYSRSFVCRNQ